MKRKKLKQFLSAVMSAVLLFPSAGLGVFAAPEQNVGEPHHITMVNDGSASEYGYQAVKFIDENGNEIDMDAQLMPRVQTCDGLPAQYNSYDYGKMTGIRNQGQEGLCWAHAGIACAEASMISQNLEALGSGDNELNYSEKHLAWFTNGALPPDTDPMEGDGNAMGTAAYNQGGNIYNVIGTLGRWSGVVAEATVPYETTTGALDEELRYQSLAHLQKVELYSKDDRDSIKQAVMNHGGVFCSYYSDTQYYTKDSAQWSYYGPGGTPNHAVTIVGWDDNFDKSNFTANGRTPANNGAWIIKNSWGENWGVDGLFYMSYEEPSFDEAASVYMEANDNYDNNYQYDGSYKGISGLSYDVTFCGGVNVFTANKNEELEAVGFYVHNADISYTIEVFTGEDVLTAKESKGKQTGTLTYAGYYTIPLDSPIKLKKGEEFAVSVTLTDGKKSYLYVDEHFSKNSRSYINQNGNWIDITQEYPEGRNCRIKAYTTDLPAEYTITVSAENGNVTADKASAVAGEEITLVSTPDEGYQFKEWKVVKGAVTITDNKFTMPEEDVEIQAVFEKIPEYQITVTVEIDGNGTASANKSSAVKGTEIILTAAPAAGYRLKEWKVIKGTVTIKDGKFTMPEEDVEVQAVFEQIPADKYQITVTVDSEEKGTASADKTSAAEGEEVILTSKAKEGYQFKEWKVEGDTVVVKDNKFTMPGKAVTIQAVFEPLPAVQYQITVTDNGNGTASANPSSAAEGETVRLKAVAAEGYRLKEWQVEKGTVTIENNVFVMPAEDVEIQAVFELIPAGEYQITITDDGNGTASASKTSAAEGEEITLTASAAKGYHFKEWKVIAGDVEIQNNTFIMPSKAVEIQAIFELTEEKAEEYLIILADSENGTASADKTKAAAGEKITLTAKAAAGYQLKEWKVIAGDIEIQNNTFTMPAEDVEIQAVFELVKEETEEYLITVTDSENGTASADKTKAAAGEKITLTVKAAAGYRLKEWKVITGDIEIQNNTFTMPAEDVEIQAVFEQAEEEADEYEIIITTDGNGTASANKRKAAEGEKITLRVKPDAGYEFKGWEVISGDITIKRNSFIMPKEDVEIQAEFEQIRHVPDNDDSDDSDDDDDYSDSSNSSGNYNNSGTTTIYVPLPFGIQNTNGQKRFIKENGITAKNEWVQQNGNWYYAGIEGTLKTGWLETASKVWYFLNDENIMQTGWKMIDSSWYYFDIVNGDMKTGWIRPEDNQWYYLLEDGTMAVGWKQIAGKWYYLNESGVCLMDTITPDGYRVGIDGAWVE